MAAAAAAVLTLMVGGIRLLSLLRQPGVGFLHFPNIGIGNKDSLQTERKYIRMPKVQLGENS